jgi:uncharacterized protein (DUF305 family)
MKRKIIACALLTCGLTASADMVMDPSESKFMQDMNTSMKAMDHDMSAAPMTGSVDQDFALMMVPHHQGAIDMAKGELMYGKDPEMRHLAEKIIADQKSEIEFMNGWLKKHPNMMKGM